ncbi:hypothetical protein EI94DRAFT_1804022 [Lactarius quietus]|nr:hypothetical protein EI94DRAFT_1804022 [Lactarius quietus]
MPRGQLLLFTRPAESPLQSYPFPSPQLAAYPSSYTIISGVMSGPPLDASGVLTLKLLHFLANQRPSAQEKRGDWRLDNARQLARDNETVISPGDLEIVKERITLATEIKMGLESKRGLTRYLQAREYRKASKETLKFVKTVSDRARDSTLGQNLGLPNHDALSVQRTRGLLSHIDAVPLPSTEQGPIPMSYEASSEALGEAQFYYSRDPLLQMAHTDPRATSIRKQLGAKIKPNLATHVESMYNFRTSQAHASISYNAGNAQELLKDLKFIYPDPQAGRDPYRHPIIQRAIDTTWFRNKDDIGVVNHEQFSPIPIPIIAITLTVIEWCIGEWSDGTRRYSSWDDVKFQTVYHSHVSSLLDFQARNPASDRDPLYQLQCDLLRNAR